MYSLTDGGSPQSNDPFTKVVAHPETAHPKIAQLVEQYLEQIPHAGTRKRTKDGLKHFVTILGNKDWTAQNVLTTWTEMKEATGWGNKTLETSKWMLKAFEKWLWRMGICRTEYTALIRTDPPTKLIPQTITMGEYKALIGYQWPRALKGELDMVYVVNGLWMTGLAMVDLCLLQWKDINIEKGVILIARQKTKSRACIPLTSDSPFYLELQKRYVDRMKSVGSYPSVNGVHYVDNCLAGLALSNKIGTAGRIFNAGQDAMGMRRIHFHDFRATFITHCITTSDPTSVAMMTGHDDPSQLLAYATPDIDHLRMIVEGALRRAEA